MRFDTVRYFREPRVPFNWWDAFRCTRKWHGTFVFFVSSLYIPRLPRCPFDSSNELFLRRFSTVARIPATSVAFVTDDKHRRVGGM